MTDQLQGPQSGHELTRVGLIEGLQALLGPGVASFSGGNIILGGAGSDLIEGRGGNDLIDGDRWLDAYIEYRPGGGPPQRADSVAEIAPLILNGTLSPSDVRIMRVIRTAPAGAGIDTAAYDGDRADYDVFAGPDGTVRVRHLAGDGSDGTDTLRNIEQLQFADQSVTLGELDANAPATGAPAISDPSPARGQQLTTTVGTVADDDGFDPADAGFEWQAERDAPQGWTTIATGTSFTPGADEVGQRLRVVLRFTDGGGSAEQRTSAPTAPVADVSVPSPPAPEPQPQPQQQPQAQQTPTSPTSPAPTGASCTFPSGSAASVANVRLTRAAMIINQRTSQRSLRLANALVARMDGRPAPSSAVSGTPGSITLSVRQLRINQRIAQEALRRVNAIILELQGKPVPPKVRRSLGRYSLSSVQMRINQRIANAALARVQAAQDCLDSLDR